MRSFDPGGTVRVESGTEVVARAATTSVHLMTAPAHRPAAVDAAAGT
ncbi:hypothetical protein [Streptomyces thermolineatus]